MNSTDAFYIVSIKSQRKTVKYQVDFDKTRLGEIPNVKKDRADLKQEICSFLEICRSHGMWMWQKSKGVLRFHIVKH